MRELTGFCKKTIYGWIVFALLISKLTSAHEHNQKTHVDHSGHQSALKHPHFELQKGLYPIEDVQLLDQNNKKVQLANVLSQDRPVALNFIFTTCTTICPVMTATFSQMQQQLDKGSRRQLRIVSISIDPEYDGPKQLKAYARQFNADDSWLFLTGNAQDITKVLKSFDVYTGSKLNHRPVVLFRKKNSDSWLRVEGLASGRDLAHILKHQILN